MKTYIGTKIIKAEPMPMLEAMIKLGRDREGVIVNSEGKSQDGYMVTYPDGYVSWSPKEQFEIAYREITQDEKNLI